MEKKQIMRLKSTFDDIVHQTEDGVEFWYARELQKVLGYTEWRNFSTVMEKAKIACNVTNSSILDHFVDVNKMVERRRY